MCGASNGYVSAILFLMARCTDDLTLVFAPADMLLMYQMGDQPIDTFISLFFEHFRPVVEDSFVCKDTAFTGLV